MSMTENEHNSINMNLKNNKEKDVNYDYVKFHNPLRARSVNTDRKKK